jgi:hypothetical protein
MTYGHLSAMTHRDKRRSSNEEPVLAERPAESVRLILES